MTQRRRRRDRMGREILTASDYAQMIVTAIVLSILFAILAAGAFWLDGQYQFSPEFDLPGPLAHKFPAEAKPICVPIGVAAIIFFLLMNFVATIIARFYKSSKDELDENGMYKRQDGDY